MKTISVSAHRRPLYTHLVLSALAQCRGVEKYDVMIQLDASGETLEELLRACSPFTERRKKWLLRGREGAPVGCTPTIVSCMDWGFDSGADFHIHLEDDTLPHRDFLVYMEWASRLCWSRAEVFSVCGYSRRDGEEAVAHTQRWFTPWGWGTRAEVWSEVRDTINFASPLSWDCQMNTLRGARHEIVPALGLVQNIGQYDGTYNDPGFWLREQFAPGWAAARPRMRLHTGWRLQGELAT